MNALVEVGNGIWNQVLIHTCVPAHSCRDTEEQEEEDEEQEEVTGSLLRGGAGGGEGGDGDILLREEVCPPLLPVSPSLYRAQSFLHGINLRVQQVSRPAGGDTGGVEEDHQPQSVCLPRESCWVSVEASAVGNPQ